MNYVQSFDLFGVPAAQIPSITKSGAPTTTTEAAVGCLYMNTDNGDLYKCTAVSNGVYTWEKLDGTVKSVNGVYPDDAGNVEIETSGVTVDEKKLMLYLFKAAVFTEDVRAKIEELETLWTVHFKISNHLSGVKTDNPASAVIENGSYLATLTAEVGYKMDGASVVIMMGGNDITSSVYSNGVVSITTVTGNVVISATAIEIPHYTVTNNLIGMVTSNSDNAVLEGGTYTATLTAADGYKMDGAVVSVIMGDTDVTETAYSNGVITITNATGNIIINATAAAIPTYKVTNNLTGVTNSNAQTEVTEGFYSATLTAEDGFVLNSVVITMGGVDVTDSVYTAETGSILITEVTGDIVITAVAAEPEYLLMTANGYADNAKFYSGEQGDTSALLRGVTYANGLHYAAVVSETDAEVTVKLSNSSESDVSVTCYVGATHTAGGTQPNLYYSKVGYSGSVRAGGYVEFKYTVPAQKYLAVHINKANLTVEVMGNYNIHQPVAEYEMVEKYYDAYNYYADGTTDNKLKGGNYITIRNSTAVFEEDTPLRITLMGDTEFSAGFGYVGSRPDADNGDAYYCDGYGGFAANLPIGGMSVHYYTVRAGHYLTVYTRSGSIYVEKA